MTNLGESIWSDQEKLDFVYQRLLDGLSSAQIANDFGAKFGIAITRNSVIGIAHRQGWKLKVPRSAGGRKSVVRQPPSKPRVLSSSSMLAMPAGIDQEPPPKRKPRPDKSNLTGARICAPTAPEDDPAPYVEPPVEHADGNVTLVELTSTSCRWPLGDPRDKAFRFCGAHAPSQPYCGLHALAARSF